MSHADAIPHANMISPADLEADGDLVSQADLTWQTEMMSRARRVTRDRAISRFEPSAFAQPVTRSQRMARWAAIARGDRFFKFLAIILLGYSLVGRSFAYLGVPPLFVGELVLLYGCYTLIFSEDWSRILRTAWVWPLLAFMGWGLLRTVPFVGIYGADALRDAAIWAYGAYAIVVASLICAVPRRLLLLEGYFKSFAKILLILSPLTYWLSHFIAPTLPNAPWGDVPWLNIKGGDVVVHLTGVFAYTALLGGLEPWFVVWGTAINLILNFTGRAAMVTMSVGCAILLLLKPRSELLRRFALIILLGIGFLWIFDIHFYAPGESPREISADQIVANLTSIFGDSDNQSLSGSKEWRLAWWDTIIGYTFHGKYFWGGKGFGVNLADDDGFQVKSDGSLRSPHNGHLTVLARSGVPGLILWGATQLGWAGFIVGGYISAKRRQQQRWAGVFGFLLIYWFAFMVNAAFDVYLEGPVGGIWMWTIYGVGLAALWIHRNCPETLTEPRPIHTVSLNMIESKPEISISR
jgi:hypothetical protein